MAKISLITASYNRGQTIKDTLDSINNQTYRDIEHIIIDGGSTDNSIDLIKEHGKRVSKLVSEKDDGFYDAYNKGLREATGDIIGFLNSDDFYISDDVISKVMTIFEDENVEACHANLIYVDYKDTNKIKRHWESENFSDEDYIKGYIPAHPTVFFRRSVYDKIGNFDTSFSLVADYDLLLRAFYVHKVKSVHINETWVRMRVGGATGGDVFSLYKQNAEQQRARLKNGIKTSFILYVLRKLIDRIFQILRAKSFHNDNERN